MLLVLKLLKTGRPYPALSSDFEIVPPLNAQMRVDIVELEASLFRLVSFSSSIASRSSRSMLEGLLGKLVRSDDHLQVFSLIYINIKLTVQLTHPPSSFKYFFLHLINYT